MKLFVDTEFCYLPDDDKDIPDLISLGICAENGEIFYEVFDNYEDPSDWVKKNVEPVLIKQPANTQTY